MMADRRGLALALANELIASEPALCPPTDRDTIADYVLRKCSEYLMGAANDRRMAVADALIRKRDRGVPWTPEDEEQAVHYGVSGPMDPERRAYLEAKREVKLRLGARLNPAKKAAGEDGHYDDNDVETFVRMLREQQQLPWAVAG